MPSIRRSLILYFFLLMGLTLGVVGLFVRHFVAEALKSRAESDASRIHAETEARVKETVALFDRELYFEGRSLLLEFFRSYAPQSDRVRLNLWVVPLGLTDVPLAREVASQLTTHPAFRRFQISALDLVNVGEPVRVYDPGEHFDDAIFQISANSRSNKPVVIVPPNQPVIFASEGAIPPPGEDSPQPDPFFYLDHRWQGAGDYRLMVQRFGGNPPGPDARGGRRPRPPGPPPPDRPPGNVLVYGRSRQPLDQKLAELATDRDAKLAALPLKADADLRTATARLALIASVFLLILPVGGWLLVGRGLRPLDTLTTAVSRVSERDFRLPVAASDLSTELAPIHDRLSQTLDALRRAFEREKEAVGDISHELRTPLAALQTTIDVALRKPREAEFYRTTLGDCRDITKQLARLVDRILTLATLDAGETPSWTRVDVAELACDCATLIRPLAEGHGLTLQVDLDPDAHSTTDPDKLREVMLNLLHNAVEYNRPGGSVRLGVSRSAGRVVLSVTDTGIGMTDEVRAKIFERFYRADPSRHATGIHAGLGLAIVKEYVERLHGEIQVASSPGQGSRFEVTIPELAG